MSYSVPHHMAKPTNDLIGQDRTRQVTLTAAAAAVFAFVISYVFAILNINDVLRTGLVSDIKAYEPLAEAILDGQIPYIDFPFEHLPVSIVPIAIIGLVAQVTGISMWLLWPIAMTPLFIVTARWVDRLRPEDPPGLRFVAVAFPLLPLVLFRLEPWVELLAVGALLAFFLGYATRGVILTVLGALGKGWPIVLALFPWKLGKVKAAAIAAGSSVILLAVVALRPGFQSGREFEGIHTETIAGSVVLLFRHLAGVQLGTAPSAGALYVSVPDGTVLLNAIPGVILVCIGLVACVRLPISATLSSIGLIVLGIILASPLSSTQFIYWIAPFVALLALGLRRWYIAAGVFAFASIAWYQPDSLLWSLEVVARNTALLVLGAMWAISLAKSMRSARERALL